MSNQQSLSDVRHISSIARHWAEEAFQNTRLTKSHFSELVCQAECVSHLFKRTHNKMPADEHAKKTNANFKQIQRFLDGECNIPADVILPWIDALPAPYDAYLRNDIAELFNPHEFDIAEQAKCIKEMAEGITALASGDKDSIRKELIEARDAISSFLGDV